MSSARLGLIGIFGASIALTLVACGPAGPGSQTSEGEASSEASASSDASVGTTEGPGSTTSGATSSGPSSSSSSSSATSSATTTATTTAATSDCDFVCEIDVPGPTIDCDIFAQDCPEGQKCAAYDSDMDGAWDSVKCFDVTGDGQLDDPCMAEPGATGVDTCDAGYMCWNVDEEGMGVCHALCTGTPENPMCPEGSQCAICQTCVFPICIGGCDPLLQDCNQGDVCIGDPNGEGFVCVLDASEGMGPEGTPCKFANVCDLGNMCVSPDFYPSPTCEGELGCCAPFCDLDDASACEGLSVDGVVCVPYYEPGTAPPGLENVGLCGVAP